MLYFDFHAPIYYFLQTTESWFLKNKNKKLEAELLG